MAAARYQAVCIHSRLETQLTEAGAPNPADHVVHIPERTDREAEGRGDMTTAVSHTE